MREPIEDDGAKIVYTAPYSPDLNPIEFFFSVYKAALKRCTYVGGHGRVSSCLETGSQPGTIGGYSNQSPYFLSQAPKCVIKIANDDFAELFPAAQWSCIAYPSLLFAAV